MIRVKRCQQNKTKIGRDSLILSLGERIESSVGDVEDMPEDDQNEKWLKIVKAIKLKNNFDKMEKVVGRWVQLLWKHKMANRINFYREQVMLGKGLDSEVDCESRRGS